MICIHHNKDMDGYCSGAIVRKRYPDCKLIGWDYKDPIPDFGQFVGEEVIMIDCTFPIDKIEELREIVDQLTIIDHHVSFKDTFCEFYKIDTPDRLKKLQHRRRKLLYIYEERVAACELGWKHLFEWDKTPEAVTLIGRYDTWRQEEGDWENETLPFKYYMYSIVNSAQNFPDTIFDLTSVYPLVQTGKYIMKYQRTMDESSTRQYSFETEAYGGLRALCLNIPYFSSETVASLFNPEKHDIMIGFAYDGQGWRVSLRSESYDINCSEIAKARGGGGHIRAAGFSVNKIEEVFI